MEFPNPLLQPGMLSKVGIDSPLNWRACFPYVIYLLYCRNTKGVLPRAPWLFLLEAAPDNGMINLTLTLLIPSTQEYRVSPNLLMSWSQEDSSRQVWHVMIPSLRSTGFDDPTTWLLPFSLHTRGWSKNPLLWWSQENSSRQVWHACYETATPLALWILLGTTSSLMEPYPLLTWS